MGIQIPATALTGSKTILIFIFGLYLSSKKKTNDVHHQFISLSIKSACLMVLAFIGFIISQTNYIENKFKITLILISYMLMALSEVTLIPSLLQRVLGSTKKKFNSIQVGLFYAMVSLGLYCAKFMTKIFDNNLINTFKTLTIYLLLIILILYIIQKRLLRRT